MKKIIFLILALALFVPSLLYGAAATITSVERLSRGNLSAVIGTVTINSGDTIATGLRNVKYFMMAPNPSSGYSASANYTWTAGSTTATAGTVTVRPGTNGIVWRFEAVGTP